MKPISRNYKAGSIIYFEADKNDKTRNIFVLQKGSVSLTSTSLDGSEEIIENVKIGEFFGVKSALGNYPREETAKVLRDSTILVFTFEGFEKFAIGNTRLILQMLRVFSSNLRKIHKKVKILVGQVEEKDVEKSLLSVAEFYHKNGNYSHAVYIYQSYLKNYPSAKFEERAQRMLSLARNKAPYPSNMASLKDATKEEKQKSAIVNSSTVDSDANTFFELETPEVSGIEEEDSFLDFDDDDFFSDSDGLGFDESSNEPPKESVADLYFSAMNLMSEEDYQSSEQKLNTILEMTSVPLDQGTYIQKAHYDMGRVLAKQKKWKESLDAYLKFIRKFPHSEMLRKAMNEIAAIYEETNHKEKAISFYQKVSKMAPEDKYSIAAMNKVKELTK